MTGFQLEWEKSSARAGTEIRTSRRWYVKEKWAALETVPEKKKNYGSVNAILPCCHEEAFVFFEPLRISVCALSS